MEITGGGPGVIGDNIPGCALDILMDRNIIGLSLHVGLLYYVLKLNPKPILENLETQPVF
jgi:hypothetical protein